MFAQYYTGSSDYSIYFTFEDIESLKQGKSLKAELLYRRTGKPFIKIPFEVSLFSREEWRLVKSKQDYGAKYICRGQQTFLRSFDKRKILQFIDEWLFDVFDRGKGEGYETRYDMGGNKIHIYFGDGFSAKNFYDDHLFYLENFDVLNKKIVERHSDEKTF